MPKRIRLTTDIFVERAIKVHVDQYDYSKVEYKNAHSKVCIICPEHGEFWQTPDCHNSKKQRCPECCGRVRLTTTQFIQRAVYAHGNFYDYSKVEYINMRKKVCIICPDHGEFWQTSEHHLQGKGCPKCKSSKGENAVSLWLTKHDINHVSEYRFNDCKNINPLPFDFYLPNHHSVIEYDGKQHFEPIDFFGGEKAFIDSQRKDNIKTEYCENNNIKLIRIRYDESVNDKLAIHFG